MKQTASSVNFLRVADKKKLEAYSKKKPADY